MNGCSVHSISSAPLLLLLSCLLRVIGWFSGGSSGGGSREEDLDLDLSGCGNDEDVSEVGF